MRTILTHNKKIHFTQMGAPIWESDLDRSVRNNANETNRLFVLFGRFCVD